MASTSGLGGKAIRSLFNDSSSSEEDLFGDDSDAEPNYLPQESSGSEDNVSVAYHYFD